jgi:hypothetical protein
VSERIRASKGGSKGAKVLRAIYVLRPLPMLLYFQGVNHCHPAAMPPIRDSVFCLECASVDP